jgi:hypothetical protein
MKNIGYVFLLLMFSCVRESQFDDFELETESSSMSDLDSILSRSSRNITTSDTLQKYVETQTTKIITKTVESIDELKEKNTDLKIELKDANKKIDNITNVNVGVKFNLLPISDSKENR